MRLSELTQTLPIHCDVVQDGDFNYLGNLDSKRSELLSYAESSQYLSVATEMPNLSALVLSPGLYHQMDSLDKNIAIVITENPRLFFFEAHNYLARNTSFYGSKHDSVIAPSAFIHQSAVIANKNVIIGENVVIGPNSVIQSGCQLKANIEIGANCTIGSVGMEYKRDGERLIKVEHIGRTIVEPGVDIQDGSSIACGLFDDVHIGEQTKIGSLVRIGHEVCIGKRCMVSSQALLSGSSVLGDDVWVGPGAIVSNGVKIANQARILLGSVVISDVDSGQQVAGNFAIERRKFFNHVQSLR